MSPKPGLTLGYPPVYRQTGSGGFARTELIGGRYYVKDTKLSEGNYCGIAVTS